MGANRTKRQARVGTMERMGLPKSLLGEQDVQTLSVFQVSLSMEEDPVGREQDFLCCSDETRLGVTRRVEDLPCHFIRRTKDNEAVWISDQPIFPFADPHTAST